MEQIKEQIARMDWLRGQQQSTPHNDYSRQRILGNEAHAIHRSLSNLVALHYGWKLSRSGFSLRCLARRGHHDGRGDWYGQIELLGKTRVLDHYFFCRTPDRRAAAIISQPYNLSYAYNCDPIDIDAARQKLVEEGAKMGLCVAFPTEIQSWWYHPVTTLVVITPQS